VETPGAEEGKGDIEELTASGGAGEAVLAGQGANVLFVLLSREA
jgi:hypothetical protein